MVLRLLWRQVSVPGVDLTLYSAPFMNEHPMEIVQSEDEDDGSVPVGGGESSAKNASAKRRAALRKAALQRAVGYRK